MAELTAMPHADVPPGELIKHAARAGIGVTVCLDPDQTREVAAALGRHEARLARLSWREEELARLIASERDDPPVARAAWQALAAAIGFVIGAGAAFAVIGGLS